MATSDRSVTHTEKLGPCASHCNRAGIKAGHCAAWCKAGDEKPICLGTELLAQQQSGPTGMQAGQWLTAEEKSFREEPKLWQMLIDKFSTWREKSNRKWLTSDPNQNQNQNQKREQHT
jgi:hypothetical protein